MIRAIVLCSACGAALDGDARFCVACGKPVPATAPDRAATMEAPRGIKGRMLEQLRDATLGEYEILLELGSGGMATVYLAHDLQLDRKVAIKLMHPTLVVGDDMVERFILEARTAAGLSHANIVPIYAVKVQEELLYFVMKFVEGRPLDSIIKAESPLAPDTVRHVVTQVADALGYAHRHGVVHRDIKPANIIVSTDGHPILADFGIAKVADHPGLTLTGATIGTPTYMSPEQCSAEPVTGATDQYSLGVTAFEMLTGAPPFDAPSHMTIMLKQMSEPAPLVQGRAPACPADLAAVIDRMLAKEPSDRFATMEEVVETLHAGTVTSTHKVRTQLVSFALADPRRELLKRVSTPRSPIPTAARRSRVEQAAPRRSVRPVVIGAAAGILVALSALFVIARRDRERHAPPTASPAAVPSPGMAAATPGQYENAAGQSVLPPAPPPQPVAPPSTQAAGAATPERTASPGIRTVRIIGPETLSAGSSGVLQVEAHDRTGRLVSGKPVAWASNASDIVSVGSGGRIEAHAEGRATISATVEGVNGQWLITVNTESIAAVNLDPALLALTAGESAALAVHATGTSGRTLDRPMQWSSNAPQVATVTAAGKVTAVASGVAIITVSTGGRKASAAVTVTPVPTPAPAATAPAAAADAPLTDAERRAQVTAMVQAYARAIESGDIARVRQFYPTMSAAREQQLRQALATMENLKVQLSVGPIQADDNNVTAHVTGIWTFSSQGQHNSLPADDHYQLERRGGSWVIADIR